MRVATWALGDWTLGYPGLTLNARLKHLGFAEILMECLSLTRQLLLTYPAVSSLGTGIVWFLCVPSISQHRVEHGEYLWNRTKGMLACWLGLVQRAEDRACRLEVSHPGATQI